MTTTEQRAANRELFAAERAKYIGGELTHQQYYRWLADWIGLSVRLLPATDAELLASTDEHLNDIRLPRWDAKDLAVRQYANAKGLPWSLSDTVCCLKAVARRRIEELKGVRA